MCMNIVKTVKTTMFLVKTNGDIKTGRWGRIIPERNQKARHISVEKDE